MSQEPTFMDFVQLHERKWGESQYCGRPALADLMRAPIVAMWVHKGRFMFSTHQQANELNELVHTSLVAGYAAKPWKLAKIFVNQQSIEFQIKIVSPAKEAEKPVTKPTDNQPNLVPLNNPPEIVPLTRQPEVVPYRPRIAAVNPLREPRLAAYVDDHERLMAAGKVIKTYMTREMKPGRNVEMRKSSDGRKSP